VPSATGFLLGHGDRLIVARLAPMEGLGGSSRHLYRSARCGVSVSRSHDQIPWTIVQKYRPRSGRPASRFQRWIDESWTCRTGSLSPCLGGRGDDAGSRAISRRQESATSYMLAQIAIFNSLVSISQEHSTPVFALTAAQLGLDRCRSSDLRRVTRLVSCRVAALADRVEALTSTRL